ncbi:MAG: amidohydrolase [Ahrensia sp.]|nr:amidohydrolase [Ahrensia sp.]
MPDFDAEAFRRDIHANPELASEVPRTAKRVADTLEAAGLDVTRNVGGHGVVASVGEGAADHAVLLRADMDALPITEKTGVAHESTIAGRHHGCGHDGHTTMLVAAGLRLAANPPMRRVHLMFQPDEENGRGAKAMIDDGLLERFPVSSAFGLHVMPGMAHGTLATASGPFCAFEENFEITLRGHGGHASMPDRLADPLVAGAELVSALQTVVSRNCDPRDHAVLSVTNFETDGARNVVPSTVRITGDCRGFEGRVADVIKKSMKRIATGIATAHGIEVDVRISRSFSPLNNNSEAVAQAAFAAKEAGLFIEVDTPRCGFSEDFAAILERVPGAFVLIGQGGEGRHGRPLHDPGFEFDDTLIPKGAAFWEALARSGI